MNSLKERFVSNIKTNNLYDYYSCWNWNGPIMGKGYGQFIKSSLGTRLAHRVSWILFRESPIRDLFVLHKCDNRLCVNPWHLFLGTQEDNMKDMAFKKRSPRGEANVRCKLTFDQVIRIRLLHETGQFSQHRLSKIFHCSDSRISLIVNNITRVME
jgi:predicted XRE-type DNA-binding protein